MSTVQRPEQRLRYTTAAGKRASVHLCAPLLDLVMGHEYLSLVSQRNPASAGWHEKARGAPCVSFGCYARFARVRGRSESHQVFRRSAARRSLPKISAHTGVSDYYTRRVLAFALHLPHTSHTFSSSSPPSPSRSAAAAGIRPRRRPTTHGGPSLRGRRARRAHLRIDRRLVENEHARSRGPSSDAGRASESATDTLLRQNQSM